MIEISEACRYHSNGSSRTLVWFGGLHEPFLGAKFFDENGLNLLSFIDLDFSWYTMGIGGLGDFEASLEWLRAFAADNPASYCFAGQSSGGYAALRFAHQLCPAVCVAFAPQTQNLANQPDRFLPPLAPLYREAPVTFPVLLHLSRSEDEATHGKWDDWRQIEEFMKMPNVTVVRHPYDIHAVSLRLYAKRLFLETIVSNFILYESVTY